MKENYDKPKRIASNTIVLFVRMFVLTIINLYAVRLVLRGLGQEDYGIFNTVAAVVLATNFFGGVLTLSIQRFYSIAIGKHNEQELRKIFSASMVIMVFLSVFLIVLFETIGLWCVNHWLVIPIESMPAVNWVYQFTMLGFICSLLQIPYMAAIFTHEDMGGYTVISTLECLLKLATAFLIGIVFVDRLVLYSAGLFVTAMIVLLLYGCSASHQYAECHYTKCNEKQIYKGLLSFSGWTLFGSIAGTGIIQGNALLLNLFYGPFAMAAYGIAMNINNAFGALCNSMVLSFRPVMIQSYAEANYGFLNQIFSACNKSILYILIIVSLPIISQMNTILSLWLGDPITTEMVLFGQLVIIYTVFMALHNPITTIIQATGHVKEYHVSVESCTLLCLPLTWLLFHLGLPSHALFFSMITVTVLAHIIRIFCLKKFYPHFSINQYVCSFLFRGVILILIGFILTQVLNYAKFPALPQLLLSFIVIPIFMLLLAYLIGFEHNEKKLIHKMVLQPIKNKFFHIHKQTT